MDRTRAAASRTVRARTSPSGTTACHRDTRSTPAVGEDSPRRPCTRDRTTARWCTRPRRCIAPRERRACSLRRASSRNARRRPCLGTGRRGRDPRRRLALPRRRDRRRAGRARRPPSPPRTRQRGSPDQAKRQASRPRAYPVRTPTVGRPRPVLCQREPAVARITPRNRIRSRMACDVPLHGRLSCARPP